MIELNLVFIQKQNGGALTGKKKELTFALETVDDNFYGITKDNTTKYHFVITKKYNEKYSDSDSGLKRKNLANGGISVAFVIRFLSTENCKDGSFILNSDSDDHLYVLKIAFEEINFDFADGLGSKGYTNSYSAYKILLPTALLDIKFYGSTITGTTIDIPLQEYDQKYHNTLEQIKTEYNELLNKHEIIFTISKFYQEIIINNIKPIIPIINLVLVVNYLHNCGHIIIDLKSDNIIIENDLIKFIDFDIDLFTQYKEHNINILFNEPYLTTKIDNYLKKKLNISLGLNNQFNRDYYTHQIEEMITYNLRQLKYYSDINLYYDSKLVYNLLKENYKERDISNLYYETNCDFLFNKNGVISICDIIISLYFEKNDFIYDIFKKGTINSLQLNSTYIDYRRYSIYYQLSSYHNTNDILILLKLLYGMPMYNTDGSYQIVNNKVKFEDLSKPVLQIKPEILKDQDNQIIIDYIKFLLFDPISECGLLAPEYYNMPPFYLVLKYLMIILNNIDKSIQIDDESMFKFLYKNLVKNVGKSWFLPSFEKFKKQLLSQLDDLTEREIGNLGKDYLTSDTQTRDKQRRELTYNQWIDIRINLQIQGDPKNHSDENIILPVVHSRFEQNDFKLHNGHRMYKWVFDNKLPIINPHWIIHTGLCDKITVSLTHPLHPFIITHNDEYLIQEAQLPIDMYHTFTLDYSNNLINPTKSIHKSLKNNKNNKLIKKLKKIQDIVNKGFEILEGQQITDEEIQEYIIARIELNRHIGIINSSSEYTKEKEELKILVIEELKTERLYNLNNMQYETEQELIPVLKTMSDNYISNFYNIKQFIKLLQQINIIINEVENEDFYKTNIVYIKELNKVKKKFIYKLIQNQLQDIQDKEKHKQDLREEYEKVIKIEGILQKGIKFLETKSYTEYEKQTVIIDRKIELKTKKIYDIKEDSQENIEYLFDFAKYMDARYGERTRKINSQFGKKLQLDKPIQIAESRDRRLSLQNISRNSNWNKSKETIWPRGQPIISIHDKYLKYKYKYLKLKEELSKIKHLT